MSLCNNMVSFTVYSSWYGDRQQRVRQLSHDVYGGRQQRCRRPPYYEQNSINNHTWPHNHYNCMVKSRNDKLPNNSRGLGQDGQSHPA